MKEKEKIARNQLIKLMRLSGRTYQNIADETGLTRQRIYQIINGYSHRLGKISKKKCKVCWSTKNLEIHHLNFNPLNSDFHNLKVLCRRCHRQLHRLLKNIKSNI